MVPHTQCDKSFASEWIVAAHVVQSEPNSSCSLWFPVGARLHAEMLFNRALALLLLSNEQMIVGVANGSPIGLNSKTHVHTMWVWQQQDLTMHISAISPRAP